MRKSNSWRMSGTDKERQRRVKQTQHNAVQHPLNALRGPAAYFTYKWTRRRRESVCFLLATPTPQGLERWQRGMLEGNIWALGKGSKVCCWIGLQLSHLALSLSFLSFSSETPEADSFRQCVLSWRRKQRQHPGLLHATFTGVIADVFNFNLLSWFHPSNIAGNKASSWRIRRRLNNTSWDVFICKQKKLLFYWKAK